MKGLELAESFYLNVGRPKIREEFPEYYTKMAIGLVGPGSECFGFDDELSQDHDWGPGFCLWLSSENYERIGSSLQAMYEQLPPVYAGFGPRVASPGEEARVGVGQIVSFYKTYTGLDHVPQNNREWLSIPEQSLAVCTNGKIFHDPSGKFSLWRKALKSFYPNDVRLKKIASRCLTVAQYGQYNYQRSIQRSESVAAQYALSKFCSDLISLVFLINREYMPFYKWMHKAVKRLPLMGKKIHGMIDNLMMERNQRSKFRIIEECCALLIEMLRYEDLTDAKSEFLLDHAHSVHDRIKDAKLGAHLFVVN